MAFYAEKGGTCPPERDPVRRAPARGFSDLRRQGLRLHDECPKYSGEGGAETDAPDEGGDTVEPSHRSTGDAEPCGRGPSPGHRPAAAARRDEGGLCPAGLFRCLGPGQPCDAGKAAPPPAQQSRPLSEASAERVAPVPSRSEPPPSRR